METAEEQELQEREAAEQALREHMGEDEYDALDEDERNATLDEMIATVQLLNPAGNLPPAAPDDAPPPPVHGLTPDEIDKRFAKAEQSWKTYERSIDSNLDCVREQIKDCPLCFTGPRGFVNLAQLGNQSDELKRVVMECIGLSAAREYKQADDIQTCPKCDGEGYLATGSHVFTASTILCPTCKGYGCAPPPVDDETATPVPAPTVAPVTAAAPPAIDPLGDPFKEPVTLPDGRANPNFGKMPQFKVPVPPWGSTAGLQADGSYT